MVLLEYEYCAGSILYEEALGMDSDYLAGNFVLIVQFACKYLCDSGFLNFFCCTELNLLSTLACNEKYIVQTVDTADFCLEAYVQGLGAGRKGEVGCSETPLARNILHSTEIILDRWRPELTVF